MAIKAAPAYGATTAKAPPRLAIPTKPASGTIKNFAPAGSTFQSLASVIGGAKPAPAATLTTGQIGTGGGGGPQTTTTTVTPLQVYQDQILSDPGSVAAQGQFDANVNNLALARKDAIQKAIVNAGWDPGQLTGGLASYAGDIDQSTLAQALQNPMSQRAQLQKQLTNAQSDMPYDLAASGLDRSGALAIGRSNLGQQYDTASYQGLQDLLGTIGGAVNTYATNYNTAQQQLAAAREAVANRLAQNAGYSQTVTTSGGDYGDDGGGDYAPAAPVDANKLNPAYYPAPPVNKAVQKVIKALGSGAKKSPYYYQNLKNIMAG